MTADNNFFSYLFLCTCVVNYTKTWSLKTTILLMKQIRWVPEFGKGSVVPFLFNPHGGTWGPARLENPLPRWLLHSRAWWLGVPLLLALFTRHLLLQSLCLGLGVLTERWSLGRQETAPRHFRPPQWLRAAPPTARSETRAPPPQGARQGLAAKSVWDGKLYHWHLWDGQPTSFSCFSRSVKMPSVKGRAVNTGESRKQGAEPVMNIPGPGHMRWLSG